MSLGGMRFVDDGQPEVTPHAPPLDPGNKPEDPPDYICEDGHHVIAPPSDPSHPCQTPSRRRPGQLCGKPLYPYGPPLSAGGGP